MHAHEAEYVYHIPSLYTKYGIKSDLALTLIIRHEGLRKIV